VVIRDRSLRYSSLVLVAAALAMVVVLAGGLEQRRSTGDPGSSGRLGALVLAPVVDDASLGILRSTLQIQGRRAAPEPGTAVLQAGNLLAVAFPAIAVVLLAERVRRFLQPDLPCPRGPPAA
jgi:hypothetical protein